MDQIFSEIQLKNGDRLPNGFMLAPMTNQQSHEDGTLSDDEYQWLLARAKGGFGLIMTCATNVNAGGKAWPGQLGAFDDKHLPGLSRLAQGIKAHGGHASVQLFHGGRRAEPSLISTPLMTASDDEETGAVAMSLQQVHDLRDDFISAAIRCHKAGFDSVELHAAHGFAICQFLSPEFNRRSDDYGGTPDNRARLLREIIAGIRAACGDALAIGVRLSPERHGLEFEEMYTLTQDLNAEAQVDFIDMSLHDAFKVPNDSRFSDKTLAEWYLGMPRGKVKLGVGGKINSLSDLRRIARLQPDFVVLGRLGILHHDFPKQVINNSGFQERSLPVRGEVLRTESLSQTFVDYLKTFENFVTDDCDEVTSS